MNKLTILIVDDEMLSRKALVSGVDWEKLGIGKVLDASSAEAARKYFMEERVDLALIDIEMPGESGLDLLEWVRQEARLKIPCAFLTCHASFDYAQTAIRLECFDYLLKPAVYTEVEALVKRMIESCTDAVERQQVEEYGRQYLREKEMDGRKYEKEASNTGDIVDEQIQYIRTHLFEKLSLTELAYKAGLNPNYFNKVFKARTGDTVNKFIINERMQLAASLLQKGNLKAYAVAELVGYDNYSHFVNMFKKTYGVSPDQWRGKNEGRQQS